MNHSHALKKWGKYVITFISWHFSVVSTFLENGIKVYTTTWNTKCTFIYLNLAHELSNTYLKYFFFIWHSCDLNSVFILQVLQTEILSLQDCLRPLRLLACTYQLTLESMTDRVALIALRRSQNQPTPTPNPTSVTEVSTLWQSYDKSCSSSRYE